MIMFFYALTIFLSAFLLFQIQPMIAKVILPWFGGSAGVWSTCLLFFQFSLLGGYLYAYGCAQYLKPKAQALLHITLLAASLLLLPAVPSPAWKPTSAADPTLRILLLLAVTIGLPYFLLSATSPLLQNWFLRRFSGSSPYRLFALSNFGSMLALLSYPVVIEPRLTIGGQAYLWSGAYVLFVTLGAAVAWGARRSGPGVIKGARVGAKTPAVRRPAWTLPAFWIGLSACASTLLLAITNHLSQNVAPIPFLWVLPLSLYLLSFILCFESERFYRREIYIPALWVMLGSMAFVLYYSGGNLKIKYAVPVLSIGLFLACMVCHGELVRLKPHPRFLTLFYLLVSTGGAAGGLFVALIAPQWFSTYLELPLGIIGCAALLTLVLWYWPVDWGGRVHPSLSRALLVGALLTLTGWIGWKQAAENARYRSTVRNFYGVLRVRDDPETNEENAARLLIHGTISHGKQLLDPEYSDLATAYYGDASGIGRAFEFKQQQPALRAGIIGLGAGVLAVYGRSGDVFRFYEINPLVYQLASSEFTFLPSCPADKTVLLGDARLTLERQADQQFDILAVDAFSSDAIPVHLLTREAFTLYFRHMKPGGILAVHVSNRYLDLAPVVVAHAQYFGKAALAVDDKAGDVDYLSASLWILLSDNEAVFHQPIFSQGLGDSTKPTPSFRVWTDDYSNLFQILNLK